MSIKNVKEKLSLGLGVTKIKTDTAGACFQNSGHNQPPPITHRVNGKVLDTFHIARGGEHWKKYTVLFIYFQSLPIKCSTKADFDVKMYTAFCRTHRFNHCMIG